MPLPDFKLDCETHEQLKQALIILDRLDVVWYGDGELPSSYVPPNGRYLFVEESKITYMTAGRDGYYKSNYLPGMTFAEFMEVYGGATQPHIEFDAREFEAMLGGI